MYVMHVCVYTCVCAVGTWNLSSGLDPCKSVSKAKFCLGFKTCIQVRSNDATVAKISGMESSLRCIHDKLQLVTDIFPSSGFKNVPVQHVQVIEGVLVSHLPGEGC